ncbi:GDSL-type esterase/lipase family protein [Tumebacillus sp. DT12]|uniref:GDSL-type esterase/lipase family protein n=1 Tax=Tumebacillus lacus TaxID=2995335 RepID=A0ABT3X7Z4_9BACL|nr:GDSL-type esterase/lipase family protein [Tumebacillus lacus]MCX7570874.1 GDSL-type esterase/lipase family protein [Tumebacillus lacus]
MRKKSSSALWISVATVALVSICVLGGGFLMAVTGPKGEVASNAPVGQVEAKEAAAAAPAANEPYRIVALGDSLTKGVGDTTGKGYVGFLKDKLEANGRTVHLQNLGISGLESTELAASLDSGGIKEAIQTAQLITISIGGNDVTHSIGGVGKIFSTSAIPEAAIREAQAQYTKNLGQILQTVRQHNPEASILVLGLYNPFEGVFEDQPLIQKLLSEWNANLIQTAQTMPNVKVIPTFDIFQWNVGKFLSPDHFHPNEAGYERIAERFFQALPEKMQAKKQ